MASSAKAQVAQAQRPVMLAAGRSARRNVCFDSVPDNVRLPAQVVICVNAYFDLLSGDHAPVSIEDVSDQADLVETYGYKQSGKEILDHYKLMIEGKKPWKKGGECIRIGYFS